ncbi:hypothetical protein BJ973_000950 [Actinoplanes tereljensis]|uniref:NAD(P)H nitroreductase n=1 Tax=Paractinoplanes tereljensis TaxID=571912 RepID=A0A919NYC3_9ACTN|nr:nitroreductase [Actinoplanes tereljensis]GIF26505.1 hypothetical protein Ate02nite_92350 [Actinoplanes tereljensis]
MDIDALTHPTDTRSGALALADAAATAGYAPSIHNTQPWRWRLTGTTLDLHLVRSRIPPGTDPDARLATLSCGAALHHARIAMAAHGWQITVNRMLRGADRDLLARLHVHRRAPVDLTSAKLLRAVPTRQIIRRPGVDTTVTREALTAITTAVEAEDTRLYEMRAGQLFGKDTVLLHAAHDEPFDWLRAGEAVSAAWLTATGNDISVVPHSAPIETAATRQSLRTMIADAGFPCLLLRLTPAGPAVIGLPRPARRPANQTIERY